MCDAVGVRLGAGLLTRCAGAGAATGKACPEPETTDEQPATNNAAAATHP